LVNQIIASGDQPTQPGVGWAANSSTLAKLAIGSTGLIASGFIPTPGGGRMWDKYINTIRAVETGFPGAILRTFRTSEFLSPLETWDEINVTQKQLQTGNYATFLKNTFGPVESLTMKRTGSVFGEVTDKLGNVVGYGLQIEASTAKGTGLADYYARIIGTHLGQHQSLNDALLRTIYHEQKPPLSFEKWRENIEPHLRRRRLVLGSKLRSKLSMMGHDIRLTSEMSKNVAKFETMGKLLRAKAASTAGRLNILLKAPFEVPFVKDIANKIPGLRSMSVQPGTNMDFMRRFAWKGMLAGAAWKGLEYVDYLRSQDSAWAPILSTTAGAGLGSLIARKSGMKFSKAGLFVGAALGLFAGIAPRFDEGLFYGTASIWADANIARAQMSEASGFGESLRRQEEISPAMMSPKTGIAFGLIAGLGTGLYNYGSFLTEALMKKEKGQPFYQVLEKLRETRVDKVSNKIWESKLGKVIQEVPGLRKLAKIKSPMMLGFIGGVATWQAISSATALMSGNLLAAIPGASLFATSESSEELRDIYSGTKEVAIRKGRWWEFGKGSYEGGKIDYFRPHAIARLRSRAYQKGLYGDESERWDYDPLLHPINALFGSDDWKYHYEIQNQYDRPAPLTSTYGEDIPFVGPLVAATFGKLFKPRKLVRPEEWITGEGEFIHHPDIRNETEPVYDLGGLYPGAPVAPEEGSQVLNKLNYRRREAVGLVGFAEGSITKALIGREEILPNKQTFDTMGKEAGSEYWLWKHLNLGGAIGSCLPAGQKILTPNGVKNIEEIKVGDRVYDCNYKEQKVLNTFVRNCNNSEKIITLNIATGNKNIKLTDMHKVAVIKRIKCRDNHKRSCTAGNPKKHCKVCGLRDYQFNWEWLESKYIEPGDFVAMPLPKDENIKIIDLKSFAKTEVVTNNYIYNNNISQDFAIALEKIEENNNITRKELRTFVKDQYAKEALRSFRQGNKPKRIPRFIEITEDLAYLLGWYIAEGCSSEKHGISLILNINEYNIAETLGQIYTRIFGYSYSIQTREKENSLKLCFNNQIFTRFLSQFGKGAKNKELSWLVNLSPNLTVKLVDGLLNGDGWLNNKLRNGGFTSSSNKLVRDLWLVLCNLGIFSTVTDDYIEYPNGYYPQGTKRKNTQRSYLQFNRTQFEKLLKILNGENLFEEQSNGRNFKTKDFVYLLVRKVFTEDANNRKVYDIEVEESHCFIGDYLLLHNSEPVRRFIPRTPSYLESYNPLKNSLPSWLPDDYFLDLKYGNPYSKIPEAELRLPGAGYAARFPELEGVNPEDYPLAHRVKILGDVAMYSDQYRIAVAEARRNAKNMSLYENHLVQQTVEQVRARKKRKEFQEYTFNEDLLKKEQVTVTQILSPRRFKTKEYGDLMLEIQGLGAITKPDAALEMMKNTIEGKRIDIFSPAMDERRYGRVTSGSRMKVVPMIGGKDIGKIFEEEYLADPALLEDEFKQIRYSTRERLAGTISERILHNLETPLEYLTPLSPASKLVHQRSAIEDYVASEAIGTQNSFWDKPVENFFAPALNMTKYKLGMTEIPESIQQRRDIQEYFDMLKWVKMSRLEAKARQEGDITQAAQFREEKQSTVFGTDVFNSPVSIMKALPRNERDYFAAFTAAKTEDERAQILELIPENEKRIYLSQWMRQAEQAAYAKREAKIATEEDEKTINLTAQMRQGEGFEFTEDQQKQWLEETGGRISFDEWLREQKAEEYFATHSLPDPSWLGWNPAIDIEDVKLVTVEMAGLDHHLFDLWEQRKRALARKPYINEDLIRQMMQSADYQDSWIVARNSKALAEMYGDHEARIKQSRIDADLGGPRYNIEVLDQRRDMIEKTYKMMGV
jgi:intein/homing endonuclease